MIQQICEWLFSHLTTLESWLATLIPTLTDQISTNPIVHQKNEIQTYFIYQIKTVFFFSTLILIPNYLIYLISIYFPTLRHFSSTILWITILGALIFCFWIEFKFSLVSQKSKKMQKWVRVFSFLPIFGFVLLLIFISIGSSHVFIISIMVAISYVIFSLLAVRLLDDRYYYDYRIIKLTFIVESRRIKTQINRESIQGKWVVVKNSTGAKRYLSFQNLKNDYIPSSACCPVLRWKMPG